MSTRERMVSMLVMPRIMYCKALCCVGMLSAVGLILVENTLETIVENVCALTVVCT